MGRGRATAGQLGLGWLTALLAVSLLHLAKGARVLGVALPAFSHQNQVFKVGQELAARGHTFTMLASSDSVSMRHFAAQRLPGVQVQVYPPLVGVRSPVELIREDPSLLHTPIRVLKVLGNEMYLSAMAIVNDDAATQRLREAKFDVLLRDACYWPAAALQQLLSIPSVGLWPLPLTQPYVNSLLQTQPQASYLPQYPVVGTVSMSTWGRLKNLLAMHFMNLVIMPYQNSPKARFLRDSGYYVPEIATDRPSTVATVVAHDFSALSQPQLVSPRTTMVGSVTIEAPSGDIAPDVEAFLSQGPPAIYMSMGTAAVLTHAQLLSMTASLSGLQQNVLWKLGTKDLPGNLTMEELPLASNVKVVDWVSQIDILAHPSVDVFVTQGGMCSLQEAMALGVKMLVIPLSADQPCNAAEIERIGSGLQLDHTLLDPAKGHGDLIGPPLQRLLTEPRFQEAADRVARRMWRPYPSRAAAADVVERALHTGGELYLETADQDMPWWQRSMLDVYAVVAAVVLGVLSLLIWVLLLLAARVQRLLSRGNGAIKAKAQ